MQTDIEDFVGSPITLDEVSAIRDVVRNRVRPEQSNVIAGDRLRNIVARIERMQEERKALSSDITDIFKEAKSSGFDVKVLRRLLVIRKQDSAEVVEEETVLDGYRRALGM
jgi:uncharacterized protein (UPF0335 family)